MNVDPPLRLAELCAALSLTTDLASGVPFEKGLRTCLLAVRLAEAIGVDERTQAAVFHAALLRSIGCTAHASENAALFVDDTSFQSALKRLDAGDPQVLQRQMSEFGDWAPERRQELAARFVALAPTEGPRAAAAGCEVSRTLGDRLGMLPEAVEALDDVYERWDGLGIPAGRRADELSPVARIVHVAEQAVLAHAVGGRAAAVEEVRRRSGGHLDPALAAAFVASAPDLLGVLDSPDLLQAVLAAEPGAAIVPASARAEVCATLAVVVDLKGRYLLGHSAHVAEIADAAGGLAGFDDGDRSDLVAAAFLHDLGRAAVSSEIWDRPGPLGVSDRERVRLHTYWTERILTRCPALAPLAPLAAAHHERGDGTGYHRAIHSGGLTAAARLLAACDVAAALTEDRPHRAAYSRDAACRTLTQEAIDGRLDPDSVDAVLAALGHPRRREARPTDLTAREIEVLRLAARGMTNADIAERLVVSERTVGHHLAHVYDKTGRRTRAGAAVYAIEHGLLPE